MTDSNKCVATLLRDMNFVTDSGRMTPNPIEAEEEFYLRKDSKKQNGSSHFTRKEVESVEIGMGSHSKQAKYPWKEKIIRRQEPGVAAQSRTFSESQRFPEANEKVVTPVRNDIYSLPTGKTKPQGTSPTDDAVIDNVSTAVFDTSGGESFPSSLPDIESSLQPRDESHRVQDVSRLGSQRVTGDAIKAEGNHNGCSNLQNPPLFIVKVLLTDEIAGYLLGVGGRGLESFHQKHGPGVHVSVSRRNCTFPVLGDRISTIVGVPKNVSRSLRDIVHTATLRMAYRQSAQRVDNGKMILKPQICFKLLIPEPSLPLFALSLENLKKITEKYQTDLVISQPGDWLHQQLHAFSIKERVLQFIGLPEGVVATVLETVPLYQMDPTLSWYLNLSYAPCPPKSQIPLIPDTGKQNGMSLNDVEASSITNTLKDTKSSCCNNDKRKSDERSLTSTASSAEAARIRKALMKLLTSRELLETLQNSGEGKNDERMSELMCSAMSEKHVGDDSGSRHRINLSDIREAPPKKGGSEESKALHVQSNQGTGSLKGEIRRILLDCFANDPLFHRPTVSSTLRPQHECQGDCCQTAKSRIPTSTNIEREIPRHRKGNDGKNCENEPTTKHNPTGHVILGIKSTEPTSLPELKHTSHNQYSTDLNDFTCHRRKGNKNLSLAGEAYPSLWHGNECSTQDSVCSYDSSCQRNCAWKDSGKSEAGKDFDSTRRQDDSQMTPREGKTTSPEEGGKTPFSSHPQDTDRKKCTKMKPLHMSKACRSHQAPIGNQASTAKQITISLKVPLHSRAIQENKAIIALLLQKTANVSVLPVYRTSSSIDTRKVVDAFNVAGTLEEVAAAVLVWQILIKSESSYDRILASEGPINSYRRQQPPDSLPSSGAGIGGIA